MRALSSPRLRRRLAWSAGIAAVAAAAAALVVLLPGGRPAPRATPSHGAAGLPRERTHVTLTRADRAAITATLDRFVPAAAGRHDLEAAWSLAGPGLRSSVTREDWLAGRLPVVPFEARDRHFAAWRAIYSYRDEVNLDLFLQPRDIRNTGAIAVNATLVQKGGRWLVDQWYPVAVFTPPASRRPWVTGPPDFTADGYTAGSLDAGRTRAKLDPVWLALPAGVLGLSVLVPLGFAVGRSLRARRRASAYAAPSPVAPPLPRPADRRPAP